MNARRYLCRKSAQPLEVCKENCWGCVLAIADDRVTDVRGVGADLVAPARADTDRDQAELLVVATKVGKDF